MRTLMWVLVIVGLAASAHATTPSTSSVFQLEEKPLGPPYPNPEERVTGDTVANAFVLGTVGPLPLFLWGSTCGFANDYDAVCPYSGSTAPDVVYQFIPTVDMALTIDLCGSTYDTKVYVFQNEAGNIIACNDDYCAYQSALNNVPVAAGNTYYIIVDGYGGNCGDYIMQVGPYVPDVPCILECPAHAIAEGEVDCYDGYVDTFNGGCNVEPFPVFQMIEPGDDPTVICGTTGVFQFGSLLYRDTDWFELVSWSGGNLNLCLAGDAEIPCSFFIIDGRIGCPWATVVASGVAGPCAPVSDICWYCPMPGPWWVWAGSMDWDLSHPCGSTYVLELWGFGGGSPANETTWGRVKGLFR